MQPVFKAWWFAACALLLVGLPTVAGILPDALLAGLSRTHLAFAQGGLVFFGGAAVVWWLAWKQKTEAALLSIALAAGIGAVYMRYSAFPALDKIVSVRSFLAKVIVTQVSAGCVDGVSKDVAVRLELLRGPCGSGVCGGRCVASANSQRETGGSSQWGCKCTKSCTLRACHPLSQEAREKLRVGRSPLAMAEARKQLPKLADAHGEAS